MSLSDFFKSKDVDTSIKMLALCHTTMKYNFHSILQKGFFKGTTTFFYYGNAKYEDKRKKNTLEENNLPICFIVFDFDRLSEFYQSAYVFDSGRFPEYKIPNHSLNNYKIPTISSLSLQDCIRIFIKEVFDDNHNYIEGVINNSEIKKNKNRPHDEIFEYIELNTKKRSISDNRSRTIEIQFENIEGFSPDYIVFPIHDFANKEKLSKEEEDKLIIKQAKELDDLIINKYRRALVNIEIYNSVVDFKSTNDKYDTQVLSMNYAVHTLLKEKKL